jgi:ribosomal protein S16
MECGNCGSVVIDLDAAEDGAAVTVPGLFKPAKPTIFSVLREEREAAAVEVGAKPRGVRHGMR